VSDPVACSIILATRAASTSAVGRCRKEQGSALAAVIEGGHMRRTRRLPEIWKH